MYELSSDVFNSTYKQLVILLETKMFLYAHCNMYLKSLKKNNIIWQSKRIWYWTNFLPDYKPNFKEGIHLSIKFEDIKKAIRSCKSKNAHWKKDKRTNNDLQNITQKTKDTKLVVRSCKSKDRQYNGHRKKDEQWSTKYYRIFFYIE